MSGCSDGAGARSDDKSGWVQGMRDAFFDTLLARAVEDERVVLITSDTGAICHDRWRALIPERYINVGIAEQNLIGVAAGMAMSGKLPFVYAIIPFVTMRCYEQIRVDLGPMRLPVVLVGVGAGYDYSTLGPTHHGTEDISLMRGIPDMTVLVPSDNVAAAAFAEISCSIQSPTYIRLTREGSPLVYDDGEKQEFSRGSHLLRQGDDLAIVAVGRQVVTALSVAERLRQRSIRAAVIDAYRVKPLAASRLLEQMKGQRRVVTIEDHYTHGGLGSALAEVFADEPGDRRLKRLGLPDRFNRRYGDQEWMQARVGLDPASVTSTILEWLDVS